MLAQTGTEMTPPLASLLANSLWWQYEKPLRHVAVQNVFRPEIYSEISQSFEKALTKKRAENPAPVYSTRIGIYDAELQSITPQDQSIFPIFMSEAWHRLLASFLPYSVTNDISLSLHVHKPGSKSGWVHNDLNIGWFPKSMDAINVSDIGKCNYRDGTLYQKDCEPVERVRAATMIFYLNNGPWDASDGGETGLYESDRQNVNTPSKRMAPLDNSLFMFECTPYSFHSFVTNPHKQRNSIIMWLHRPKEDVLNTWGSNCIAPW